MSDERAREGVVHLQAAALELIAAGRAFLDVAEELVREPAAVAAILQAAKAVVGEATQAASDGAAGGRDRETPPDGARVTRIEVT